MLTIAYMTSRLDPKIEWFFQSLAKQSGQQPDRIVVVDYHKDNRPLSFPSGIQIVHVPPKPNVWQGPYRLTQQDYFAAANARNTAICHAPDGTIAFVDDLSVLMPGWLECVNQSERENYIALGAYKKMKNMVVQDGIVTSYEDFPPGVDSRLHQVSQDQTSCAGSWLFGCSFACPVEALLDVNGLDENCDSTGLGSEDYCLGIRIGKLNKYSFRYDRRMMTWESEEHHHIGTPMLRRDKGVSPNDKSHAMLNAAMGSAQAPNFFGEGGIRALRQRILAGEPFPIQQIPQHDWFDSQPLSEL